MLLCAGLGSRLRPLTVELPKPLVPIGDRPMLAHLIDHLRAAGGTLRAVNTHYRPEKIREFLDAYGVSLTVSHESSLLGTAGGIAKLRACFGPEPLVIWNGDILAQPSLEALVEATRDTSVALAVTPRECGQGTCGLDAGGNIVRLRSERYGDEVSGADYMGIAALRADALAQLPDHGCLVGDYLMPRLRAKGEVKGVIQPGRFSDVGSLESYLSANLDWLRAHWGDSPAFVHPTADVDAHVQLRDCVIMAGARVAGRGCLERVVVWPGAEAEAPLRNAVVTAHAGTVTVG